MGELRREHLKMIRIYEVAVPRPSEEYPSRIIVPAQMTSLDDQDQVIEKNFIVQDAIIDTGATTTIIDWSIAKKIHARTTGRKVTLMGLGGGAIQGHEIYLFIKISENEFFEEEVSGLVTAVAIKGLDRYLNPPVLIGMDFLTYETMQKLKFSVERGGGEATGYIGRAKPAMVYAYAQVLPLSDVDITKLKSQILSTDPVYWAGQMFPEERMLMTKAREEILPFMKTNGYIYSEDVEKGANMEKCPICKKSVMNGLVRFVNPKPVEPVPKEMLVYKRYDSDQLEYDVNALYIHFILKHEGEVYSKLMEIKPEYAKQYQQQLDKEMTLLSKFFATGKLLSYRELNRHYNSISVKDFVEDFRLEREDATELMRRIVDTENLLEQRKLDVAYEKVDETLEYANKLIPNSYGVESLMLEGVWISYHWQNIIAEYVNRGETYTTTLIYDTEKAEFLIWNCGDYQEDWEKEHSEEEE